MERKSLSSPQQYKKRDQERRRNSKYIRQSPAPDSLAAAFLAVIHVLRWVEGDPSREGRGEEWTLTSVLEVPLLL